MAAPTASRLIPESVPLPSPLERLPAQESGDHLRADEFERRYAAMPNVKKAELCPLISICFE
jgi:hypothetical protein